MEETALVLILAPVMKSIGLAEHALNVSSLSDWEFSDLELILSFSFMFTGLWNGWFLCDSPQLQLLRWMEWDLL